MSLNRRNFLKGGLSAVTATVLGGPLLASERKSAGKKNKKAELKLSFQERIPPGESLNEKFDYMEREGVVGFEPHGKTLASRFNEITQALRGRNIKVSAVCAGFEGFLLSEDPAVRRQCMDTSKELLAICGELGAQGLILVPAFNRQLPVLPHTMQTREFLIEELRELGQTAAKHGTSLILEPLNRKEAFYLRQVGDAASICRDINAPGVMCMGDFWHMTWEENDDAGAFLSAGEYLAHVHIASRANRKYPGEDGPADDYVNGFRGLKMMGYDKYVSFECSPKGEKSLVLPRSLELIRRQWKQAEV